MTRLAIFDLDGTLVDSRADIARAANHARAALGLAPHPLDAVVGFVGDGAARLIERLTPAADAAGRARALAAFEDFYGAHCCVDTVVYPGIVALLGALRDAGWTLAVATNKPDAMTRTLLAGLDLARWFAAVRGGDGPRKPDPGQLTALMAEAGAPPAATWMIGDHRTDIGAARAAGCRVAFCRWGFGQHDGLAVDADVATPGELLPLLLGRAPQLARSG